MAIYVIGDLHLSFGEEKPMSIFGTNWEGHSEKIKEDWLNKVKEGDTVILAGDFSWAMYLEDTVKDFAYLNSLPGKKIMLKGNHDYWWTTITSMKRFLLEHHIENVDFLYNTSFLVENKIIVGTRGWSLLDSENSKKMINREANRLELSIKEAIKNYGEEKEKIAIMHYPPITKATKKENIIYHREFVDIMKKYGITKCYYGHLHGKSHQDAIEGEVEGIYFKLISADYLNFHLEKVVSGKEEF